MTKEQAIEAMANGKKVRHRYFDEKEWVTMRGLMLVFEDGVQCSSAQFWYDRMDVQWETDWEIFKPTN